VPHAFVPCQDPLACPPQYHDKCHEPVGTTECHLAEWHSIHSRSITEVMEDLDSGLEVDEYRLILDADADPGKDYTNAQAAIHEWLSSLGNSSRQEEADYLEDCLAKVLVHLTKED
jgi:hypothetical protein